MKPDKITAKTIDEKNNNCPYCSCEWTQAIKTGFQVENRSTDLMLCFKCEKIFVAYPSDPDHEEVIITIDADLAQKCDSLLDRSLYRLGRKYQSIIEAALEKGPVQFSVFCKEQPELMQDSRKLHSMWRLFVSPNSAMTLSNDFDVDRTLPDFEITANDGHAVAGHDIIIRRQEKQA